MSLFLCFYRICCCCCDGYGYGYEYDYAAFWLKEAVVYEQPRVVYRYLAMFQLHGSTASGDDVSLFYSTSSAVNDLFSGNLRTPIVKSAELDDNADGMVDRIEIGLTMPLSSTGLRMG